MGYKVIFIFRKGRCHIYQKGFMKNCNCQKKNGRKKKQTFKRENKGYHRWLSHQDSAVRMQKECLEFNVTNVEW